MTAHAPQAATSRAASEDSRVRLIAFYLPQFHPIAENDAWWGNGFTEWTKVAGARPLYRGHEQPKRPGELGFYDLRLPETRVAQARLASDAHVTAFCYWHYWFNGRRLLQRPFEEVVRSGEPRFGFCLGWANQSWTGIWHGAPDRLLMEQTYGGLDEYKAHFEAVFDALTDDRAITVDGKPLFYVYRPADLPEPRMFVDCWQDLAQKRGLPGIYFVGEDFGHWTLEGTGIDARVQAPLGVMADIPTWCRAKNRVRGLRSQGPRRYPYDLFVARWIRRAESLTDDEYPCVMPNWDNTPRSGRNGVVLEGSSPELFERALRAAIRSVADRPADKRIVFIKSWNEWAEGNYLEPDSTNGHGYLDAIRRAMVRTPS